MVEIVWTNQRHYTNTTLDQAHTDSRMLSTPHRLVPIHTHTNNTRQMMIHHGSTPLRKHIIAVFEKTGWLKNQYKISRISLTTHETIIKAHTHTHAGSIVRFKYICNNTHALQFCTLQVSTPTLYMITKHPLDTNTTLELVYELIFQFQILGCDEYIIIQIPERTATNRSTCAVENPDLSHSSFCNQDSHSHLRFAYDDHIINICSPNNVALYYTPSIFI